MMITNASLGELIGAIACTVIIAGVIAYIVQWCVDEWKYLSAAEQEERFYEFSIEIPESDVLPWNDEADSFTVGEVVYYNGKSCLYCGDDDNGNAVVCYEDDSIHIFTTKYNSLMKVR